MSRDTKGARTHTHAHTPGGVFASLFFCPGPSSEYLTDGIGSSSAAKSPGLYFLEWQHPLELLPGLI